MFLLFDKDSLKTTAVDRAGGLKTWLKTVLGLGLTWGLSLCLALGVPTASAQRTEPMGGYIQLGMAAVPGLGLNVGSVSARTLYTRELHLLSNIEPAFRSTEDQIKVAALIGVSFRVFGIERLIGNAGYRGFDIDIGLRAGPGLSFSTRDSKVDRNRRFVLLVDPIIRISRASKSAIVFAEAGGATPSLRMGVWIPW